MVAEVRANRNILSDMPDRSAFQRLAEHIPTLCWIADADGYITWYNPRWYEYTGTSAEAMQGWGWQSVHDPKTLPAVLERWQEAVSSRQPFEMVFPLRGADGVFRPFLTRINPAFDEAGALTGWFGVNTDISPQIEAEAAFARSEAKFRGLADAMPQIVWTAAADGARDYFNARWYEYTGQPIGALDEAAWIGSVHPDDRARLDAAWRQALAACDGLGEEFRLRRHDGAYRWHLVRAHPERDARGAVAKWYGTCTDIEEIVQARQVLQTSRQALEAAVAARTGERNLFATLVEMTDVQVMALDLDYNILAINRATVEEMRRVYGVAAQPGDNLLAVLAGQPAQRAAAEAVWRRAFAGEEGPFIERLGNPQFGCSAYEIKFRRLRNESGETIGAFHFVADVSARLRQEAMLAQAQEALLQAQKLESMGQLTGGVAHDFNNLLTPILGTLDLLERRNVGGEREQRLIRGAGQSAERAKTLVQRLLAFARRTPLQATTIDVAQLVEGLEDLFRSTIGPQVNVTMALAADLPRAKADPHQLEMALLNLGVNARDAMDGVGDVTFSARRAVVGPHEVPGLNPGVYVRLGIADTGKGMDAATKARAIEPFFSTKGVGQGTGLGLSMAHGLASQLGGALTIESAVGAGTEVAIWLPESREDLPAPAPAPAPCGLSRTGAVLLVDDEEYIRVIAVDMLTEMGFQVHEAGSADAALRLLDAGLAPDLVITDHLMPGMTGVELARAVRARLPESKVLIVSGFAELEGLDPALPRLLKPFVRDELAAMLEELEMGVPAAATRAAE